MTTPNRTEAELAAALAAAYTTTRAGAAATWKLFLDSCSPAETAKLDDWVSKGAAPGLLVTMEGDAAPCAVRVVVVNSANQVLPLALIDVAAGRIVH